MVIFLGLNSFLANNLNPSKFLDPESDFESLKYLCPKKWISEELLGSKKDKILSLDKFCLKILGQEKFIGP